MATALLLVLLQACCLLVNFDPPQQAGNTIPPAQSATKAPGDHKAGPRTPEETIKAFVTAMFDEDQDGIRRTALPNPDLALLWQGDKLTAVQRAMAIAELKSWRFRRLKVGDEVQLPGGKKFVIDENRVDERHLMISVTDSPLPFLLVKVGQEWKVDASPVIASRKAAAAVRRRRATQKEPGTK